MELSYFRIRAHKYLAIGLIYIAAFIDEIIIICLMLSNCECVSCMKYLIVGDSMTL